MADEVTGELPRMTGGRPGVPAERVRAERGERGDAAELVGDRPAERIRVLDRLADVVDLVEGARAVPMSGNCLVRRDVALDLLDQVRAALPPEFRHARALLADREAILAAANQEAERLVVTAKKERGRLVADGRAERERLVAEGVAEGDRLVAAGAAEHERLVSATEVAAGAQREAARINAEARADAQRRRAETDEAVDGALAGLEQTLRRNLSFVERSRDRLAADSRTTDSRTTDGRTTDRRTAGGRNGDSAGDPAGEASYPGRRES